MRRRFGRRRGGRSSGGSNRAVPIDAERWLQRIIEDGVVAATRLEPVSLDGVPAEFAAVGRGEAQDGTPLIVGFAPRSGGDAVLGALAVATAESGAPSGDSDAAAAAGTSETPTETADASAEPSAEGGTPAEGSGVDANAFRGEVIAVAPQWSTQARRRLGLLGGIPFRFRAIAASSLADGDISVEPEPVEDAPSLRPEQVAAHLVRSDDRALFERASAALEGLASKHGGAIRGVGRAVELVVLSRRVAELRADDGGVVLNTILPTRSSSRLSAGELAGALDRLEGNLRRRLTDKRTLEGDDGLRARAIPLVAETLQLRGVVPWPLGGRDQDALDLAGVDPDGVPVLAAIRSNFTLPDLAAVMDAALLLQNALPHLLAPAGPPLRLGAPRLAIAARTFDAAATRLLPLLGMGFGLIEVQRARDGQVTVSLLDSAAAPPRPRPRSRRGRGRGERGERGEAAPAVDEREEAASDRGDAETEEAAESSRGGRGRRRRGRRRGRGDDDGPRAAAPEDDDGESGADEAEDDGGPSFEVMSAFDLDDGDSSEGDGRRRRGRGRGRRGRRGGGDRAESNGDEGEASPDAAEAGDRDRSERRGRGRGRGRGRDGGRDGGRGGGAATAEAVSDDDDDAPEDLSELVSDVPEFEVQDDSPVYDEDDELAGEADGEVDQIALEREKRRRARQAKSAPLVTPEPEEKPKPPRRRSAFIAHADRDSLMAAILLARDVRLIEGFWVYPQEELMTFFRSVATDLKEGTPIYVVGFQPKPARDVISTAGLYGDRVHWFDHHDWPPEDALSVRQTIGEPNLHWTPGAGSALPSVLATSTRRSRFSDKLVDLATGRFTRHDFERWGRLWHWRLGEMAGNPGDRRRDIEPLLAGRPSDLAKESARADTPPIPAEVEYVATRDFRLVHFGGFSMVVIEVPPELDPHICARVARDRYGARLSLAITEGSERIILSGEELAGKRSLDFGAMVEHLVSKLEWAEALPDEDHVARFRVRNLSGMPQRLDDVIAEVAMGRSIFES